MKIAPDVIKVNRTMPASWLPREGGHDRVQVITAVADLEHLAMQILHRFARIQNSHLTDEQAVKVVADAGYKSDASLGRLAKALFMIGQVDKELRDDLCTLYEIRNIYAHRASAGQLDEEPELAERIRNMECFKQTRRELMELPSIRHIYRAIEAHLRCELGKKLE